MTLTVCDVVCTKVLTALVQPVEPVNVVPAHLRGLAKGHVGVGDGHHGGTVVLGEGVPGESQVRMRLFSEEYTLVDWRSGAV